MWILCHKIRQIDRKNGNKLDSNDWEMTVISKDGLVTEEDYDDYDEGEDD